VNHDLLCDRTSGVDVLGLLQGDMFILGKFNNVLKSRPVRPGLAHGMAAGVYRDTANNLEPPELKSCSIGLSNGRNHSICTHLIHNTDTTSMNPTFLVNCFLGSPFV